LLLIYKKKQTNIMIISDLVRQELAGEVKAFELTEALTAYKIALGAGLTVQEASKFAEAVYKEALGLDLVTERAFSLVKGIDSRTRQITYTVTVDGKSTSSNSLIQLFRTTEGLTIMAAKRLVDGISAQNPYQKSGLTRVQAEELTARIKEAGGSVGYFETGK
jgi:ribosomal protein L7/L12